MPAGSLDAVGGEVTIEVDEDGPRQVPGGIGLAFGADAEAPPHIGEHHLGVVGEPGLVDERRDHAPKLPRRARRRWRHPPRLVRG